MRSRPLKKAYDFKLNQSQLLSLAGGDTAVTIKAAAQQGLRRQRGDGLRDRRAGGRARAANAERPEGVQPIYAPAPVVREAVLKAYPQMAQWLQPVFASLDEKRCSSSTPALRWKGWTRRKLPQTICSKKGC